MQMLAEHVFRLNFLLQAAQQERSTFVTSLMPLLAEYSLQPPVADAQSIVSNVKVIMPFPPGFCCIFHARHCMRRLLLFYFLL